MNKFFLSLLSLLSLMSYAHQDLHITNLNNLIAQLKLKTHRAEFIDTPHLLETIINELYAIQDELQNISLFTHGALQNMAEIANNLNTISEQVSALVPEQQIDITLKTKVKAPRKSTTLSRTLKVLEKHRTLLKKHMRDFNTVNQILLATLQELETIQNEIYSLAHSVHSLSRCYHHQAKDLFAIALRLFKLTGIESDTGPYLCEAEAFFTPDAELEYE